MLLSFSNIAFIVYMNMEMTHALDSKALVNLNYLSFALTKVSLIIRSIDINDNIGETQFYSDNDFLESIEMLLKYQDPIMHDASLWEFCKSSEIVDEKKLAYWDFTGTPKIRYTDLYRFIDFIVENVNFI